MASSFEIEYNVRGSGPRLSTWGEKKLHVTFSNIVDHKKLFVNSEIIEPGHYTLLHRQWFTNWQIEVYEWNNGKMINCFNDIFAPYGKTVHFYLDDTADINSHREYLKACQEFIEMYNSDFHLIESCYANELLLEFPYLNIISLITDDQPCYVNYEIRQTPSEMGTYENYGILGNDEEIVSYNFHHPCNPKDQSPYEFARSIILGPDYKNMETFIPYSWTLKNKVVS
jgi:hypothetical protein